MISNTDKGLYPSEIQKIVHDEIKRFGPNADLNHIDVSNAPDLSDLFYGSDFNGDISKWDVSNVVNMNCMFYESKFNGDISNWDVKNVRTHDMCFDKSPLENQPNKQPKFPK